MICCLASFPDQRGSMHELTPEAKRNNEAWHSFLGGEYEQPFRVWDELVRLGDWFALRARGLAHLLLGDYEHAICDLTRARAGRPMVAFADVGIALWLRGDRELACGEWAHELELQRSRQVTHYDETGVVTPFLWWASAYPEQSTWRSQAIDDLKRRWRIKRIREGLWPSSVVGYLLDELDEEHLLETAFSKYSLTHARHVSRAHFWIAAVALDRGNLSRYYAELEAVISDRRACIDDEFALALGILNLECDPRRFENIPAPGE